MKNPIKLVVLGIVLVAVMAAGYLYTRNNKETGQAVSDGGSSRSMPEGAFLPDRTRSITGDILSAESGKFIIKTAQGEATITVGSSTEFTKFVNSGSTATIVGAKLSEIQPKSTIIVYYKMEPVNSVYEAVKINKVK